MTSAVAEPDFTGAVITTGDGIRAKQLAEFLEVNDIDAEDVAYIREIVTPVGHSRAAVIEECGRAAESALLPAHFQWGRDATEQFNFGKRRAADAIRALAQAPAVAKVQPDLIGRDAVAADADGNTPSPNELPEITNLKRWRDVGDGPVTYTAGSKQFADDVILLLREYERLIGVAQAIGCGNPEDISEDDSDAVLVAHAIAEHGVGRPWGDFLPTNAYDMDQGDLIEYARAAVAALRAKESSVGAVALTSIQPLPTDWKQDQAETSRLAPKRSINSGVCLDCGTVDGNEHAPGCSSLSSRNRSSPSQTE